MQRQVQLEQSFHDLVCFELDVGGAGGEMRVHLAVGELSAVHHHVQKHLAVAAFVQKLLLRKVR